MPIRTKARRTRVERDTLGEVEVPAERAMGRPDRAGGGELPHLRPARAPGLPRGHGAHQARRGAGERGLGLLRGVKARAIERAAREVLAGADRDSSWWTSTRPAPGPPTT